MKFSTSRIWLLSVAVAVLPACQSVPAGPQGGTSMAELRRQIPIDPLPLPRIPRFSPVQACNFQSAYVWNDGRKEERRFTLGLSAVRTAPDRVLVTLNYDEGVSTAVLGFDGRLFDFNFVRSDGTRSTSENYPAQARQRAARDNATGQVVNTFTIAFPSYAQHPWQPGQVAATIRAEDGSVWGTMVYRGMAGPAHWRAAVLEIVRNGAGGPEDVGFSIVAVATMVPLLTTVRTYDHLWRLERLTCPHD